MRFYAESKEPAQKLTKKPTASKSDKRVVTNKKLPKSSKEWLQRQIRDVYVKMRNSGATEQSHGIKYRSRAGFKLQQLDEKFKFISYATSVIDLGAAPGAWSQYSAKAMKKGGVLISLDLLPMEPFSPSETENLKEHVILTGDFTEEESITKIRETLLRTGVKGGAADVILSDMASNTTGIVSLDHGRIFQLCQSVVDFVCKGALAPGGTLLLKILAGPEEPQLRERLKEIFTAVATVKPDASRQDSREMYIYARNFQGLKVTKQKADKNLKAVSSKINK